MRLLYIWVDHYRKISKLSEKLESTKGEEYVFENREFLLSDKYQISFDKAEQCLTLGLKKSSVSRQDKAIYREDIPDFEDITYIVGNNRTGKTTFLTLLQNIINFGKTYLIDLKDAKFLCVFQEGAAFYYCDNIDNISIKSDSFKPDFKRYNAYDIDEILSKTEILYHSNSFDKSRFGSIYIEDFASKVNNISFNGLLTVGVDSLLNYCYKDMIQQMNFCMFLRDNSNVQLPFFIPQKINLRIKRIEDLIDPIFRSHSLTVGTHSWIDHDTYEDIPFPRIKGQLSYFSGRPTEHYEPLEPFFDDKLDISENLLDCLRTKREVALFFVSRIYYIREILEGILNGDEFASVIFQITDGILTTFMAEFYDSYLEDDFEGDYHDPYEHYQDDSYEEPDHIKSELNVIKKIMTDITVKARNLEKKLGEERISNVAPFDQNIPDDYDRFCNECGKYIDACKEFLKTILCTLFPKKVDLPEQIENLMMCIKELIQNKKFDYFDLGLYGSPVTLTDGYLNFYEKYYKLHPYMDFLELYWDGLSSGEDNLFSFYARIFNVVDNASIDINSWILLIDEADMTYHPEWQRKYVGSLTDFFKTLLKAKNREKDSFQIILATHSPILLSDSLPGQVLFMSEKKDNSSTRNENKNNFFAANIYNIYNNGMFMDFCEYGIIGEYAHAKLNKVIELWDTKSTLSEEDQNYIDFVISNIGDEILKKMFEHRNYIEKQRRTDFKK